MMNILIGLCFGIASAVVLAVMWNMAERLRRDVLSEVDESSDPARRSDV